MREIVLNTVNKNSKNYKKYVAMVDDEDFDNLSQYKWHIKINDKDKLYAMAHINGKGIFMHRVIMNAKDGDIIDHKDWNGLNNCKSNIRFCTRAQNNTNIKKTRGISKFSGVCLHPQYRKIPVMGCDFTIKLTTYYWHARISVGNKKIDLGLYEIEEDAARAYDNKAKEIHGEFARLNFPDEI